MGLILPKSVTTVVDGNIHSTTTIGHYHTLSEFTGKPVTVADLVRHLGTMRRSEVIRVVGNFAATVSSEYGMTPGYQLQMAEHVLPADVWPLVSRKIPRSEAHSGRLFHRRQVWFLLQMAIVSCSESCPEIDPLELQKQVGLAALMASDVLGQVENTHMPELEDAPNVDQWVTTSMMPIMDHNPGNEVICRAICFWLDMQNDSTIQTKMAEIGLTKTLDDYFNQSHGLALRDFVLIMVKAYYVFQTGAKENPPRSQLLEPSIMKESQFSLDQIATAFAIVGIAPETLAPYLLGARQSWATDFSPIRRKPLIEVFPGKYTCADARIFTLFFMDGIYDLLQAALPRDKFRQLFGTMFERYVTSLLEDCLYSKPPLVRKFAPNPKFVGDGNAQAADGLILLPEMTVIMEYKASLLTRRQRYATDLRDTMKGIDDQFAQFGKGKKGVGQLIDNIGRVLKGEQLRVDSEVLEISPTSKIIPVLVVYDDSLGLHAIRNHIESKFLEKARSRQIPLDRVGPLCLLTTRDIESIQNYSSGVSVSTIFNEYCDYLIKGRDDTTGSFHGFASQKYRKRPTRQSFVQGRVEALLDEILKAMKADALTEQDKPNM